MRVSSVGQARRTALSAFAGLALGAAGVTFERAGPSVLSASTADFGTWARAHHRELLAQSMFLGPSTLPMLLFFAGLRAHLEVRRPASGRVDLSLVVLAGGAAWAGVNLAAQAVQVEMALAARRGATDAQVAHLGDRMRGVLLVGNLPLATALAAVGHLASRDGSLPGWLGRLSFLTAVAHAVPVVTARVEKGPLSRDGALAYLPYPLFVVWVLSAAVTLLRVARHERRGALRAGLAVR
jgi:hypothetical protein